MTVEEAEATVLLGGAEGSSRAQTPSQEMRGGWGRTRTSSPSPPTAQEMLGVKACFLFQDVLYSALLHSTLSPAATEIFPECIASLLCLKPFNVLP